MTPHEPLQQLDAINVVMAVRGRGCGGDGSGGGRGGGPRLSNKNVLISIYILPRFLG